MDSTTLHVVIVSVFCFLLIAFRCGYRLLSRCKIHPECCRTWHSDDLWMALAVLPLIVRGASIAEQQALSPTEQQLSDSQLSRKLLLVGRLGYAGFLWCLKLCLSTFYLRLTDRCNYLKNTGRILHYGLMLSFVGVVLATLLECRPLSLFWRIDLQHPHQCQKGLANLLVMAITNIITDILLILFPIPLLWKMQLDKATKFTLCALFSLGIFIVAITIARLPLIFDSAGRQVIRSLWASVEMGVACVVANVAFYYAFAKDLQNGHVNSRAGRHSVCPHPRDRAPTIDSMEKGHTRESSWIVDKPSAVHFEDVDWR